MNNPLGQQWIAKCISLISESAFLDLKNAGLFDQAEWLNVRYKLFPRKHSEIDPSIPLTDLGFSTRTINALEMADITTINELLRRTEEELLEIRNFGKGCLLEVREALFNAFQLKLPVK